MKVPSYRLHKHSGQAVVTINARDIYLGEYGSPESKAKYDGLIAEYLVHGRTLPVGKDDSDDLSINEIIVQYMDWAKSYYVKSGVATSEIGNIKTALDHLQKTNNYGDMDANGFKTAHLEVIREQIMRARLHRDPSLGLSRSEINRRIKHIIRFFRWAVSKDLVESSVVWSLEAWQKTFGLKKGRTNVRETEKVGSVADVHVDVLKDYLVDPVWAMVDLQRHSGMRPGEVTMMRTCDIDQTGDAWCYVPLTHKTEHHGRERPIYLGPRAQEVLRPFLRTDDPQAFLFQPRVATTVGRSRKHKVIKEPRKRQAKTTRKVTDHYTASTYGRAVARAIYRANLDRKEQGLPLIPHWHPHQLRHSAATRIERALGKDVSRVVLGHSSPVVTDRYIDTDWEKARSAMAKLG